MELNCPLEKFFYFISHQWYIKHMPFTIVLRRKMEMDVCETPRVGPDSHQSENNSHSSPLLSVCRLAFVRTKKWRS